MAEPYTLGQEVVVVRHKATRGLSTETPGIVEKIGRTLVYVRTRPGPSGLTAFRIDTGYENIKDSAYRDRILTLEEAVARRSRNKALDRLFAVWPRVDRAMLDRLSTDQIERIASILEEE